MRAAMLAAVAALAVALAVPAGARAENAVTGATPNMINGAFIVENASLALEGTTDAGVTAVTVTVDDADADTSAIVLPADVVPGETGGTWALVIPGLAVQNLADGTLTVSAAYRLTDGQLVGGASRTLVKDVVAPEPPEATPAGGLFNLDLSVTLSAEADADIRFTTDGTEPTALSQSHGDPIAVTHTTTIRALAVDRAGNVGTAAAFSYELDKVTPVTTADVPAGFHAAPVPVTLTATDAGSGVAGTWYTLDGSDPTHPDNAARRAYSGAAKPMLDDGERITYASIDEAGNAEEPKLSAAARVDTTAPVTTDDVPAGWRGAPVTVTLTATDAGGSGVATTYYTLDGSDPADASNAEREAYSAAAKPTLSDGERIRYSSVDNVGNVETAKTSAAAKVDTTKPVTADDVPATFQKGDVTVTLTATDGGSGVAATYYTLDGSDPADASNAEREEYSPAAKPTLAHGQRIRYASVDDVGNVEPAKTSAAAQVDTTKPTTSDDVPATFQQADVTVTLTATDAGGSGVATTYYTLDGSDPADPANPKRQEYSSAAKPTLSDGKRISYASVDGAGNVEAVKSSAAAQVDTTKPVTTDDVPATFEKADVTVTLTATDAGGSGVATTYYTLDGSDPADPTNAERTEYSAATTPTLSDGERIRYASLDGAGNAETAKTSAAARVDTTKPVTTDDVPAGWRGGPVTVTLTATDANGSGVDTTYYTTDGSDPADPDNPTRHAYSAAAKPTLNHGERIRYASVDEVGNLEATKTSTAAQVDTTKPVTSDDVPAGWRGAPVTVTLTATDAGGSGVATTYYTTDGSDPADPDNPKRHAYSAAAKPTLNDGERIRYASVDEVGNLEATKTSTAAQVDTTAPATTDDVPAGYRAAAITVTLTASDAASGLATTYYTTDGSSPTDGANPNRKVYSATAKPKLGDGQRIQYASVDEVGNVETAKTSAAAQVDTTAPSTADDVPATWQNADVPVTLNGTDAGSGVAETWYTTDGSNPADAGNPTRHAYSAATKPVLAHGQSLRYASVDAVGNVETAKTTAVARVDKAAPATSDNVPTAFQSTDVVVTLARSDTGGSGVATTWYTTDGSDPTSSATRVAYDANAKPRLGDGQRIRYATVDAAGNVEDVRSSTAARVDKLPPVTHDDVPTAWQKADVTVTLSTDDGAGSGVATTWYTTDGSDPVVATNLARRPYDPASKPVLGPGQRIRYFSVDRMNNREATKETAAKVDQTAPATTDNVPLGWRSAPITVTLTANDTGVGAVASTWYTLDGSDPTQADNPARQTYDPAAKPTLGAGQRIRYASADTVGNVEGARTSLAAKVDTTAPATADDVPAGARTGAVTVTLTALDTGGSGVAQTWFTTDGSDPAADTNPARKLYSASVRPVLGNGDQVRYFSTDAVGNAEAVRVSRAATVTGTPATPTTPSTPGAPAPAPIPAPAPAPAAAAPPAPAPTPVPVPQPAAPRLGGVTVASVLSQARVRAAGVPVAVKVPAGAKVVRIQVVRAGAGARAAAAAKAKPLATLYRFPKRAGTLRTKLSTPALRRLLKPGSYQLVVRAGPTRTTLGAATVKRFRVRR